MEVQGAPDSTVDSGQMWKLTRLVTVLALCALATPAVADPATSATVGVTIDPVFGQHVEPGGTTNFDGLPLLTIEGSTRYGNAELYAEGLPPVAPLTSSGTLGSLSTTLGFLFSSARWYLDGRHVSLGVGETLYHQVTTRSPSGEIDRSDIAGLRYELRGIESYGKSTFTLSLEATPVMRGGVRVSLNGEQAFDGERAAQMEMRLRDDLRIAKHVDVLAGVRYINYAAAYVSDAGLADRNTGVAFTIGALARIGHI
jgi:hypothetical protein